MLKGKFALAVFLTFALMMVGFSSVQAGQKEAEVGCDGEDTVAGYFTWSSWGTTLKYYQYLTRGSVSITKMEILYGTITVDEKSGHFEMGASSLYAENSGWDFHIWATGEELKYNENDVDESTIYVPFNKDVNLEFNSNDEEYVNYHQQIFVGQVGGTHFENMVQFIAYDPGPTGGGGGGGYITASDGSYEPTEEQEKQFRNRMEIFSRSKHMTFEPSVIRPYGNIGSLISNDLRISVIETKEPVRISGTRVIFNSESVEIYEGKNFAGNLVYAVKLNTAELPIYLISKAELPSLVELFSDTLEFRERNAVEQFMVLYSNR